MSFVAVAHDQAHCPHTQQNLPECVALAALLNGITYGLLGLQKLDVIHHSWKGTSRYGSPVRSVNEGMAVCDIVIKGVALQCV